GAGGKLLVVDDALDGIPQVQAVIAAVALDLLHGGAPYAARRGVDDAHQADGIAIRRRQLEIRHGILDFRPLVETEAAHHVVFAPIAAHCLFDLPRLRVGAVENGHMIGGVGRQEFLGGVGDEKRLVFGIVAPVKADEIAGIGIGPELLALAREVVLHHGARRRQNVLGGAVVLLQANGLGVGVVVFEIQDVADIGATPAVDGLVFVAHHADIAMLFGEQAHQIVLGAVGILILVDHDVAEPPVVGLAGGIVVLQQADRLQQQVVEIERVGVAQRFFVLLEERGDGLGLLVDGVLVEIRRRDLGVLGVADSGNRRAVLNELFFLEAQGAVCGLDDYQLIFFVVDGEPAAKSGTNARQRFPVAAQHAYAKGVKGAEVGGGIQRNVFEKRGHAFP